VLIVLGDATAAPGRRDELVAAAREVASATRADEGCVSYGFYADVDNTDRILSVEIWADRESLEAHMTHDHTQQFLRVAPGLVSGEPAMSSYAVRGVD
jgi:quinol monooxygenase YgiN